MPSEDVTLRDHIAQQFAAHEQAHVALAESITKTFAAHERLHEAQAMGVANQMQGHQDVHRAHDLAHGQEHHMTEGALSKADTQMNQRLEAMNEFRGQLRDQAAQFINRDELEARTQASIIRHEALVQRVIEIEKRGANLDGKIAMLGIGMTVIVIAINVGMEILRP